MKYSNTRQRILAVEKILLTTKYKLKISEIIEELEEKFDKFEKELITYSEELSEYENQGEEYQQKFSVLFLSELQHHLFQNECLT